jgi:hypothetical protein
MVVLKLWSTMRMCEIGGLDSQLMKWTIDDKYGQSISEVANKWPIWTVNK